MKNLLFRCALGTSLLASVAPAFAGPRDAAAVLNRCGSPFKGDETILENTVAGGRRLLNYQRGTLTFNRVGNDGWTFVSGDHRGLKALNAEQMAEFMPCLKEGLADSTAPGALPQLSGVARTGLSLQDPFARVIALGLLLVGLIGGLFALIARRFKAAEEVIA